MIVPKKRRFSQSFEDNSSNVSHNHSTTSLNASAAVPPSPWETRRMKADLIEAKTRVRPYKDAAKVLDKYKFMLFSMQITKFKQEIDRLHKLRQESDILYENRVTELKKQCDFSAGKIQDLEKHMQILRKREYAAKQEMLLAQKETQQQKHDYEDIILKLQRAKHDVEENARLIQNGMANELSEYKRHSEKLELVCMTYNIDLHFLTRLFSFAGT